MDADADLLRAAGLRVTTPRLAVLRASGSMPHATADDILTAVSVELPTTSHQAVYGVLGALTGAGLVRRIEPAGSPARYERRTGTTTTHIVCTMCGAVEDVDCAVGHAPCLTPSETHGFAVTTAEVTYWASSANAAQRRNATTPRSSRPDPGGTSGVGRDRPARHRRDAPHEQPEPS